MKPWKPLLATLNPPAVSQEVKDGIARALDYLREQATPRTPYLSSTLTPDDPAVDRRSAGAWTGTWTAPVDPHADLPYTPVQLRGPLFFPIVPGVMVDFTGVVDVPFYSMDGYAGRHDKVDPEHPGDPEHDIPPEYIDDPSTHYADGGVNWGRTFVVGSVDGATQFIAMVQPNATWSARLADPPAGAWSFQLVTYAVEADALADTNRIAVGHPWLESERPGDVRDYYSLGYTPGTAQFSGVTIADDFDTDGTVTVSGTVEAFTADPGRTYQVLVTVETDVEYAWALEPVSGAGAFSIEKEVPLRQELPDDVVLGAVKLRLVEQVDGCSVRVVGQVWAEENVAVATAWPDLRIEYRAISYSIPAVPTAIVPAPLDGTWSVELQPPAVGRVSLVDVNTKRIYGQWTMPTGLMRSYIVPPQDAGQNTTSVYYDGFMDTCFLYDQAVALIAFLQAGEQALAAQLVDALLAVQNPDGSYSFANNQAALGEHNDGFIRTGAVAWVCYALLLASQARYSAWFAASPNAAARATLDYILSYRNAIGLVKGGRGQYVAGVLDPYYLIPWWSTEHNIDTWWCLDLAARLFDEPSYGEAADIIRASLLNYGWDGADGIFWQGGGHGGDPTVNDGAHALDTHTWGAALLARWGLHEAAQVSIDRAYAHYYLTDPDTGLPGFTTFTPDDGYPPETVETVWYEGSFGMVAALRLQSPFKANALLEALVAGQRDDGSYLYALQTDAVNDIHPWPCIIAPAWSILACSGAGTPYRKVLWGP